MILYQLTKASKRRRVKNKTPKLPPCMKPLQAGDTTKINDKIYWVTKVLDDGGLKVKRGSKSYYYKPMVGAQVFIPYREYIENQK